MEKLLRNIGLVALAYYGIQWISNALASKVSVGTLRAQNLKFSPTGVFFELIMPINNKTGVAAPVDGFTGSLFYGPYNLAGLAMPQPVTVESGTSTNIPFLVTIPYGDFAANVVDIIQTGNFLNGARVEGILTVGGINVPINQPITVA